MNPELEIFLGETPVARLSRSADGLVGLRFLGSYVRMSRRPTLGLHYLGKLRIPADPETRVPSFFTNLLPDPHGPLRALLVAAAGAREDQEMRLLSFLGEDLPGAIRVRAATGMEDEAPYPLSQRSQHLDGAGLRFSLAGIQLKFSMLRDGKGLTLPASGQGGDWIVKLPDLQFEGVPESEYAVMEWARASEIDVPELELVTHGQLSGIPETRRQGEAGLCLAVRRFDRSPTGRIHIEDFAQVFGRASDHKYNEDLPPGVRPLGFETLARVVRTYAPDDRREFVRRLVFMILSGNADGHLKNWSFIYRDGRTPRLSPAYDLVPTIAFPNTSRQIALPLFETQEFSGITRATFGRLAEQLQEPAEVLEKWAAEDVERVMDAWSATHGFAFEVRMALDLHHQDLRRAGLLAR